MAKFIKILESLNNDKQFDIFFHSYLETALWSTMDDNDDPMDKNYDPTDISKESYNKLKRNAKRFFDETYTMIQDDVRKAGHDFWLTQNGHGAGFWDGDWDHEVGEKLTSISKKYGEVYLYVGDDGKLYI